MSAQMAQRCAKRDRFVTHGSLLNRTFAPCCSV